MMILDLDKDNYGSTFYLSPPQLYFYVGLERLSLGLIFLKLIYVSGLLI